MAPETFTNVNVELDQQTDVWALGVILMWTMTALQLLRLEPGQWGQGQGEQVDGFDDHLHAGSLSGRALCSILAWIKMKVGNLTSSGSRWSMAAFDFFLNSDVMICNAQAGDASEWLARSWDYGTSWDYVRLHLRYNAFRDQVPWNRSLIPDYLAVAPILDKVG